MDEYIKKSLLKLEKYVRINNYEGYDPYDALNSDLLNNFDNKYIRVLLTQFFVYNPLNIRYFFKINKSLNPKALGLFLSAYCKLYKCGVINKEFFDEVSSKIVDLILGLRSKDFDNYCWGFNFNWQDTSRNTRKWFPTIVISSYVGNSILDLYEINKLKKYLDVSKSICNFILEDIKISKNRFGICFSYTPIDNHTVHNANCLGAAFLSRVYNITKTKKLLDFAESAFNFSVSYQKNDGSWAYNINLNNKKERYQIDFHQGFIIDSLVDYLRHVDFENNEYKQSLIKGADFYFNHQFQKNGQSNWRLPHSFPIDIHHQAQGIISSVKMYELFREKKYLDFGEIVTKWTIKNMQDYDGYFYYQKWPFFINKISYIRWGQAWMMMALSFMLNMIMERFLYEKNR